MTQTVQTLGDLSFDNVTPPSKPSAIIRIPVDANAPLVCKLVIDPRRPKDAFYPVYYHRHYVGPSRQRDGRNHLCAKTFGENCPECDRYWELFNEMQELKKAGKAFMKDESGKDVPTPEYKALKEDRDVFKQQVRYWFLVIPVGETKPKAILLTQEVVDKLFGCKERGTKGSPFYKPAMTGLYYTMKDRGRSPYDLKKEVGWLKLWRSGEAPRVTYHVEEAMVEGEIETKDGSKVTALQPFKNKIPESVLSLSTDDIIDVASIDVNDATKKWTAEEINNYVAAGGHRDSIPERCKKTFGSSDEGFSEESQVIIPTDDEPAAKSSSEPELNIPVAQAAGAEGEGDGLDGLF